MDESTIKKRDLSGYDIEHAIYRVRAGGTWKTLLQRVSAHVAKLQCANRCRYALTNDPALCCPRYAASEVNPLICAGYVRDWFQDEAEATRGLVELRRLLEANEIEFEEFNRRSRELLDYFEKAKAGYDRQRAIDEMEVSNG